MEKVDSIAGAFSVGFGDVNAVAAVMVRGRADVPAFFSMNAPCATLIWLFVSNDFGTRWC